MSEMIHGFLPPKPRFSRPKPLAEDIQALNGGYQSPSINAHGRWAISTQHPPSMRIFRHRECCLLQKPKCFNNMTDELRIAIPIFNRALCSRRTPLPTRLQLRWRSPPQVIRESRTVMTATAGRGLDATGPSEIPHSSRRPSRPSHIGFSCLETAWRCVHFHASPHHPVSSPTAGRRAVARRGLLTYSAL